MMEIPELPDGSREKADFPSRSLDGEHGAARMAVINRIAQSELFLIWLWAKAEHRRVGHQVRPDNYRSEEVGVLLDTYRFVRDGGLTYDWWCQQTGHPSGIFGEILHEYRTFILGLACSWADRYGVVAMSGEEFFYWKCSFWRDQAELDWLGLTTEEARALINPTRER